jgi:hypothetical protein
MRTVALLPLLFLLAACGIPSSVIVAGYAVDSASYVGTGKTVSDHALSAATKKECSVLYGLTRGQLCQDPPPKQATVPSDTRVPDRLPPGPAANMLTQTAAEPMILGDASTLEIDDAFANLETTTVSAPVPPEQPNRKVEAAKKPYTPLWTLVVGVFDNEAAARSLVKRLKPKKALITVTVEKGEVAYRVSTEPFKISEAEKRKEQLSHLELADIYVSRVCPVWMKDDRCIVLDHVLTDQSAGLK